MLFSEEHGKVWWMKRWRLIYHCLQSPGDQSLGAFSTYWVSNQVIHSRARGTKHNSHISQTASEETGSGESERAAGEEMSRCRERRNSPVPVWAAWRRSCRTLLGRPPRRSCWRFSGRCPRLSAECRPPDGSSLLRLRRNNPVLWNWSLPLLTHFWFSGWTVLCSSAPLQWFLFVSILNYGLYFLFRFV